MRKIKNVALAVSFAFLIFSSAGPGSAFAATTPSLGTAATFGILGTTYTNTTGGTTINGDLGYTTGPAVTPTVNGTTYVEDATYSQAGTDQAVALSALNSQVCNFSFGSETDLSLLPQPLDPGVYCITGAASIGTGGIILNAGGTYIFRMTGALTTVDDSVVTLSGALSCDVFWTPGQATTLGANTTFAGTVIDDAGITLGANTQWEGRALSFGETVTTDANTISVPTCATPTPTPTTGGGGGSGGRVIPVIGILKVPDPLALDEGPGSVTYNYTVWNVGHRQPLVDVTVVDDKCDSVDFISGDINDDDKLDPGETWEYNCTAMVSETTMNKAVATGYSDDIYHQIAVDTAVATVVVGIPLTPPLIGIVKVPSRMTPFPFGGGDVIYSYVVTNPGVVAMDDVTVTDDKCSPVAGPIGGDVNNDKLLDPGEAWAYTCFADISVSTWNTATAKGEANGFTAVDYAFANVLVATPSFPDTGLPPEGKNSVWNMAILAGILMLVSASTFVVLRKRKA